MATFSPKAIADGQLAAAKATLYTVPGATTTIIKTIVLVNTDASARTVNIYVNTSGTSRRIWAKDLSMAALEQVQMDLNIVLETGDLLEGEASAASVVDYYVGGVNIT